MVEFLEYPMKDFYDGNISFSSHNFVCPTHVKQNIWNLLLKIKLESNYNHKTDTPNQ